MSENNNSTEGHRTLSTREFAAYGLLGLLALTACVFGRMLVTRALRDGNSHQDGIELTKLLEANVKALQVGKMVSSVEKDDTLILDSVNHLVRDVTFTDMAGQQGSIRDYRGSVLVIAMTSSTCPISKKLVPVLVRLANEFDQSNVKFLLVNPELDAIAVNLEQHAKLLPLWRYVHDPASRLAGSLHARSSTEVFVIDRAQTLRYRGAVDDRFDVGVSRAAKDGELLRNAIHAAVNDSILKQCVTQAPGCVLANASPQADLLPTTWYNQVSRLFIYKCVECHRAGEAAPFTLETYDQVVAKASMIQYMLDEKRMPPWFADSKYGQWHNERSMTASEIELFRKWAADKFPKGSSEDAPAPIRWTTGWSIGEPDEVIEVEPQEVPAEGTLGWKILPIAYEVKSDLWVSAAEIRPSVPEVVHHAMLFVEFPADDPRRPAQSAGESVEGGGATGFWSSYFPGRTAMVLPEGRGKLIPRGAKLFIQLHYNPNGVAWTDKPKIGLKILPSPPERSVVTGAVIKWDVEIPPNSQCHFLHSETFSEDVRLLALMPHMHCRGAGAQVFLHRPDGAVETLLHVPRYDFNWQIAYEFSKPMLVTRGSRLIIRHEYDNRESNPNNPDPLRTVVHGDKTTDEMMINFFDWEPASSGSSPAGENRPFE